MSDTDINPQTKPILLNYAIRTPKALTMERPYHLFLIVADAE